MNGLAGLIADLVRQSVQDPRGVLRRLIALDVPSEARWLGLGLVVVLAVLETRIALMLLPSVEGPDFLAVLSNPWIGVPAQAFALVLVAAAIARIGALFGGRGSFADALLLVIWMEFVMTVAQAGQLVVMLLLPPLGALAALAIMAGMIWITAQMIAELHGFTNIAKVLVGMIAGFAIVVTILATLFATLGIFPNI